MEWMVDQAVLYVPAGRRRLEPATSKFRTWTYERSRYMRASKEVVDMPCRER